MNKTTVPNRCRIVLIAPQGASPMAVLAALSGGDVASLILLQWDMDEDEFQSYSESITPAAQKLGVAVVLAGEPRIAARTHADGIHFEGSKQALGEIVEKYQAKLMIGTGAVTNRDDALELGETQPDYMFFGRFGFDNKPEPHARNLKLGSWWAEMVQIPAIVLGGNTLESAAVVADAGVDFVALSSAVFAEGVDPAEAVARANTILDESAPGFEG
jgi:thiamine-phosphate pyrophosphorylase